MATNYKAGQYEDAFLAQNLQNWTLPKLYKEHPSAREGYTQFIANDRGHLLPTVPRSKASPWGTFMGTWEMPLKIPPAKLNLTSRSAAAASHLTDWIHKSTALTSACNGLRPQITGKPREPESHTQPTKELSSKNSRASSRGSQGPRSSAKMPPEEEAYHKGSTPSKVPLSRQPGCMDVRIKGATSQEISGSRKPGSKEAWHRGSISSEVPLSRQPGCMDVRIKEISSPKVPASNRPPSREANPRRAISAEVPAASRPGSMEAKAKGVSSPELMVSGCPGSMEANPRGAISLEALASGRPGSKASETAETQKRMSRRAAEGNGSMSPKMEGSARSQSCPEERFEQTFN
ncbi:protein Flattop isoform X1 [Trachemys scripta elegans]|uniref:protein Flattop isoform X1 n=1 Tax=Trachemys scripta elegans TaxID=31138 RepID=UPI00155493DD|nr:protein Flattop isoform X1 [Trachemys scripta elegans]